MCRDSLSARSDLPALFKLCTPVESLGKGSKVAQLQAETKPPAVPTRKSITPDYLVCLKDVKRFKSCDRYLRLHAQTPEQYREKLDLSSWLSDGCTQLLNRAIGPSERDGLGQIKKMVC